RTMPNLSDELRALALTELASEHRLPGSGTGPGAVDDEVGEMLDHVGERLRFTAVKGSDRRELELFSQELAAEPRQERRQRGRLEHAAAEGVRDHHAAGPDRVHEAGNAEQRIRTQAERIAVAVVEAPQDDVDPLEAAQRLEVHHAIAHRKVAPFDERVPEIPSEVGVLAIGLVVRPRSEQHDARVVAPRAEPRETVAQCLEKRREPLDATVTERLRQ